MGIKNITLEIEPGEVYGFLGPKGAGKTTVIRLILNKIQSTGGRVLVFGEDTRKLSKADRRQIGFMPAEFKLPVFLTGEQLLRIIVKLRGGIAWSNVRQLAKDFNVDLSKRIWKLSASDRRKIGLIQAFMSGPELLILDEPTHDLDLEAQKVLYSLIKKARLEGHTVLISSNSLGEMEQICDRVAVFHQGELVTVERGVNLRSRALRIIEMRFAETISPEVFQKVPNLRELMLQEKSLRCTLEGNPDALLKAASQYSITDMITRRPSLEEAFQRYYGVESLAA